MTLLHVPVSIGEVVDKITILRLKLAHIAQAEQRANVAAELALLEEAAAPYLPQITALAAALAEVNHALWQIEDAIRDCEYNQDFSIKFIDLARSVYRRNDERAAIKRKINLTLGSTIVEEKSYRDYARQDQG